MDGGCLYEATEEVIAHHEAGHAVIRVLFRIPFTKVSILSDGDTAGRVVPLPNRTVNVSNDRAFYRMTMTALAGFAAEEQFVFGESVWVERIGADDIEDLFGLWKIRNREYPVHIEDPSLRDQYQKAIDAQWANFLLDSRCEAEDLVCEQWRAIETLAKALLEKKEMGASEVRQLVRPLLH